jgi:hypothetical protein
MGKHRKADELCEHASAACRASERHARSLQPQCDQLSVLLVELEMKDTAAELFVRWGSGLERKLAIPMNELPDAKQELTQSQESIIKLKARIQKL